MTPELGQNLTVITSLGVVVVGFGFTIWRVGNGIKEDVDKKIRRNYQKVDEIRETHVSKEVCGILHDHLKKKVDEISSDVKKLLGKNGIK